MNAKSLSDLSCALRDPVFSTHGRGSSQRRALPIPSEPLPRERGFGYGRVVMVWATEEEIPRTLICHDCHRDGGLLLPNLWYKMLMVYSENPGKGSEEGTASRLHILCLCRSGARNLSQSSSSWRSLALSAQMSKLLGPCNHSISFPVRCQSSVKVLFPKVQLQGIHPHGRCDVDPPPKVASSITSLAGPPVTVAAVSA